MADRRFDPALHQTHPPRRFADFKLGEIFRAPSRTMTEGIFAAFQAASGDNHPIHYDRAYLQRMGHPDLMAHGFMTLIQAAIGASPLAHQMAEALVGFTEQSSRFLAPVYLGDTLYPAFEIVRLQPKRNTGVMTVALTIHNQTGVLVADGHQKYLLKLI